MNAPPFWLIINPSRFPQYTRILKKLMKKIPQAKVLVSDNKAHFIHLVYQFLLSPEQNLLIWGGDGTANLAINSLVKGHEHLQVSGKRIGFLRGGSGNGIQDSYEVPLDLHKQIDSYLKSMEKGYTQDVDILEIQFGNTRRYAQLFGTGLDAKILRERNRSKSIFRRKKTIRPGLGNYAVKAIKVIWSELKKQSHPIGVRLFQGRFAYKGTRTNAEFPFEHYNFKTKAPMIEVGTRPYYGSFFRICPDVVCNDGYMDAYFFNFQDSMGIFINIFNLWNGWHNRVNHKWAKKRVPLIEHFKIKEMTLKTKEKLLFHMDGDLYETDRNITLKIKKNALRVLVPESFWIKFHIRN